MATFRKLPSGKINVQIRREGQPPLSATFKNATDSMAWARKIESDIDHGKHFGYSRVRTLTDAIANFTASSATIKTVADRNRHLAWLRETFGSRKLFHFDSDLVEQGREAKIADRSEAASQRRLLIRSVAVIARSALARQSCSRAPIGGSRISSVRLPI